MSTYQPSPRRVTLAQVAKAAEVSTMAVSVVLNKAKSGTRVSPATREKIERIARELGYRPNTLAQSLRRQKRNIISLHSAYRFLDPKDEFIRVVISALHEACADNGYDLLLNCVATKQGDHDVLESALDGRIDGLILLSPPDGRDAVKLQSAGVPVVAISDRVPMLPSVIPDNFFGGQLQARHLAGLGHKRILYLGDQERYVSVVDRESGFLAEAETLGLEVELVFLARADHPQGLLGRSEVQDDLRRGRWTAIVAWSDHRAQLVCDLLTRAGFEIPRDVSVVGFNGTDHGVPLRFELTTIDAGHRNVVLQACEHLFSLLRGEAIPALTALPVTLLVGSTTGPTSEMSNEGHQRK